MILPDFQNTYGQSEEGSYYSWGSKLKTPSTYNPKDFFQTGNNTNLGLTFSTGTAQNQTFVSASMTKANGIIPNNILDRYNVTARNTSTFFQDRMKLDFNSMYIQQKEKNMLSQGIYHNSLVKLLSNKVTILPEKTTSLDSIKIQLPTLTGLTAGTSYLLPITLKEDSEVYTQATAKTRYIQIVPTLAEARIPATGTSNILDVAMEISPTGSVVVNSMIGFTAAVNNALASKSKVTVVEDASLLPAYNTTNARTAVGFPSGSYSLLKGSVDILAGGATSGLDSIKVELKTLNQFQVGKEYVLPLKIVAPETSNIPAGSSNNVLYLRIIPKLNNIDPTNKGLTGTTMSRTGWIATALNQFSTTTYAANKALDNNNTTSWLSANSALPVWWQVDMGAEKTVKGFSITPNYTSSISYNFLTMEVLTSNDGVNWTSQGSYRGGVTAASSSATNPDYKTVKFLEPVKARYYRFSITAKTSTYSAIGEVNAIE